MTNDQTGQSSRARCAWSDLLVSECAHCLSPSSPVVSIGQVEHYIGRRAPQYRLRARRWRVPEPKACRCEHRRDDLCSDCSKLLTGLLADLPELIEQLGVALRKGSRFAPRGWRRGDEEHPEEATIPWSVPALERLTDLRKFMANPPTDRHRQLADLSRLAERAHHVIDRPKDREMTICPLCREQIVILNRSLAVTCGARILEDDPDAPEPEPGQQPQQRVRICDYAASWEQHRKDLLSVNMDAMLTMNELLIVLADAGEQINRDKVNNLIRRHGLPREQVQTGTWRDGVIDVRTTWVYRLSDVMFMLAKIEAKKAG